MSKSATIFICTNCGAQSPKWSGRCVSCGQWGTYREDEETTAMVTKTHTAKAAPVVDFTDIASETLQRIPTSIGECDRVFGGGIVPGSLVLVGGEPGIGKSTLALQLANNIKHTVYASGEESAQQVKNRLTRLNGSSGDLQFISATDVDAIIQTLIKLKPQFAIIDSIQTIHTSDIPSETGSLNQIRACAAKLLELAKTHNIAMLITGHITKDGTLSGPKTLEHLVDTVAYLEQSARGGSAVGGRDDLRLLRTVKNRFGSTDEVGLFEMTASGFREVANPGSLFLDATHTASGTVISCIMEGTRPFLVEVQALVSRTLFGYPQRKSSGFDTNRLQILTAVLTRRAGVNLANQDVHVNVVGGLRVNETALDAALCLAMISSLTDKLVSRETIAIGEVGLGGELRRVPKLEQRLNEAEKLGFKSAIIPAVNVKSDLNLLKVKTVAELISTITR